jgi:hypothetical protein
MNITQHHQMGNLLYLLNKSRHVAHHEPLSSMSIQAEYSRYCHSVMDHIEAKTLEPFEIDAHLWALHHTLKLRRSKLKTIQIWQRKEAQR